MIPYYLLALGTTGLVAAAGRFGRPGRLVVLSRKRGAISLATPDKAHVVYWGLSGLGLLLLIVFSAVREDIGTDYGLYSRIFNNYDGSNWLSYLTVSPHEPGFTLLTLLTHLVTDSPRLLLAISSVLTVIPMFLALQERSKGFVLAILLYVLLSYYLLPLNIVRQGIAMAINFYSLKYLDDKRYLFVILNIIAASFHITALVPAIIQFLAKNWRPTNVLFVSLVGASIAAVVVTQLPITADLVTSINPRYGQYLIDGRASLGAVGVGTLGVLLFRVVTIAYSRWRPASRELERYQTFLMLSVPFVIIGMAVNPLSRIEFYFSICALLLIPNQLAENKARWYEVAVVIAGALAYFTASLIAFNGLLPYKTFLFP